MLNYNSFSMRPIEEKDRDYILQWRNSEKVRCNSYNDHVISQQEHDDWYRRTLTDKTASHNLFLHDKRPVGVFSLTKISNLHDRCFLGFYLGEDDVPRGTGPALEFFALDYAFLTRKCRKVCAEVFAFNTTGLRLHEKFGFVREGILGKHCLKNGRYEDIVCIAVFSERWADERVKLKSRMFGKDESL